MRKYLAILSVLIIAGAGVVGYRYAKADIYGSSLVAWWTLDSNSISGTTVTDKSGNGNSGTTGGSPVAVTGKIGQALSFDGATQYINFGTPSDLNIVGNITLSAWINMSSFPVAENGCGTNCATIIEKGYDGTYEGYALRYQYITGTGAQIAITSFSTPTSYSCEAPVNFSANTWQFVLGEYDGTNWDLYINGIEVCSNAEPFGAFSSGGPLVVGASSITGTISRFFPGIIDDARIYNRALSAAEVQQLYYQGLSQHGGTGNF